MPAATLIFLAEIAKNMGLLQAAWRCVPLVTTPFGAPRSARAVWAKVGEREARFARGLDEPRVSRASSSSRGRSSPRRDDVEFAIRAAVVRDDVGVVALLVRQARVRVDRHRDRTVAAVRADLAVDGAA